jgi:hypothetical protein
LTLRGLFTIVVLAVASALGSARAEPPRTVLALLDPPVPYRAHFYVTSARGTYRGRVWHVPGTERWDFATRYGRQSVVLNRPADKVDLINPTGHWYVGIGLAAASELAGGIASLQVRRHRLGRTTLDGQTVTRYRVEAAAPGRGRFTGEAWFTPDGIALRIAGMLVDGAGRSQRVATGLTDIRRGPVAHAELTVPAGYFGLDLGNVSPAVVERTVRSMGPMLEGRGGPAR